MQSYTLHDVCELASTDVLDHLDREISVPVLTGLQIQGDVAIVPTRPSVKPGDLVPVQGIAVVRGENGGNTHLLVADGTVTWAPVAGAPDVLDLGVVTVADDATAFLLHPEHGANAMGPGAYIVRRQREQADEIRLVAD